MRYLTCALSFGLLLTSVALGVEPDIDRDESLRDPHRFEFEGVKSFAAREIAAALDIDLQFQIAARPQQRLDEFLDVVQQRVRSGYAKAGFPNTAVTARFNSQRRRVEVEIDEGPRFKSGGIQIAGLDAADAVLLTKSLQEPFAPWNAALATIEGARGTPAAVWRQHDGGPVKMRKAVWREGRPAPFDGQTADDIRSRIHHHFAAQGWIGPKFRAQVTPDERTRTAKLAIAVDDRGAPLTVGTIAIEGAVKNSREDVLACLEMRLGMPMTWRSFAEWNRKLWGSGRFLNAYVLDDVATRRPGKGSLDIKITLTEHPDAPLLSGELSREEKLMLKARDRLAYALEELGEDVVIEGHFGSFYEPDDLPAIDIDARCVTGPGRGQVLTINARKKGESPFQTETIVSRDDQVKSLSPQSGVYMDWQHPAGFQLWSIGSLSARDPSIDAGAETGKVNFGMQFGTNGLRTATPIVLYLLVDPAAILTIPRSKNCKYTWRDGKLHVEGKDVQFTIDERTARLVELRFSSAEDDEWCWLRFENGALASELARQDEVLKGLKNAWDPGAPWKSRLIYLLGECQRFAEGSSSEPDARALAALHKLIVNWSGPPFDELLKPLDAPSEDFAIPAPHRTWTFQSWAPFKIDVSPEMAGSLIPVYRNLVPKWGAWWPLGRTAILCLNGRNQVPLDELTAVIATNEIGPLALLTLRLAGCSPRTPIQLAAAEGDDWPLTLAGFQAEYAPLLEGDSWLGRALLSLGDAIRHLDESERRALIEWCCSLSYVHEPLLTSLRPLTVASKRPARELAPAVLDLLWKLTLHADIAETLRDLTTEPPEPGPE